MNAPKYLKTHSMYAEYDYAYLRNKGYSNAEILAFWNRDAKLGCEPIKQAPQFPDMVKYFSQGAK